MIGPVLLDHSAWSRFKNPALTPARVDELARASDEDRLVVCLPFLLEAGYSARNAREHAEQLEELLALPRVAFDAATERLALDAQHQLARVGHHRLATIDVMIAALADRHDLGVVHYDRDYDVLLERTDLRFDSVWLAEPGSL